MKKGAIIGFFGCACWLVALIIRDKDCEIFQILMTLLGVPAVIAGTILTGVEKRRRWLGVGLSVLSLVFGLGFIIMLLVPKNELQNA